MISFKNIIYSLTCLGFSIIAGAAVYEHIAVIPQWAAAPPLSLAMYQGEYGLNPSPFWESIHPITLLLFITSLILHWKTGRRKSIAITLGGYLVIMVVTFIYFVPELIEITTTEFAETVDQDLTRRAGLWETLSLVRLGVIFILAINLYLGLTVSGSKSS